MIILKYCLFTFYTNKWMIPNPSVFQGTHIDFILTPRILCKKKIRDVNNEKKKNTNVFKEFSVSRFFSCVFIWYNLHKKNFQDVFFFTDCICFSKKGNFWIRAKIQVFSFRFFQKPYKTLYFTCLSRGRRVFYKDFHVLNFFRFLCFFSHLSETLRAWIPRFFNEMKWIQNLGKLREKTENLCV
jgi:hypothetical protein